MRYNYFLSELCRERVNIKLEEPLCMKRRREDIQMNVSSFRRNIKNIAHNYTYAQVKVREATSNDPWGPESTLMSEIAELTYDFSAFTDIMQMVWKRLNDHGKNWRHVYKALLLLEYLIKTGSEKVGQQCKENIYAIQTLKDFQYYEETKDQGMNVREKAKDLVNLLQDEERLKNERAKALKAKERSAQRASGFGSDGTVETIMVSTPIKSSRKSYQGSWSTSHDRTVSHDLTSKELESARPQTVGEEELQLQLALAMSREEAEQEEQRRKSDDVRLQLAISQSQHEFKANSPPQNASHMLDLLDVNLGTPGFPESQNDPWGMPQRPQRPQVDPWSSSTSNPSMTSSPVVDPWTPVQPGSKVLNSAPQGKAAAVVPAAAATASAAAAAAAPDPWKPVPAVSKPQNADPWSPNTDQSSPHLSSPSDLDEFDVITNRSKPISNGGTSPDPFDLGKLGDSLNDSKPAKKSPHSFLGENSSLVNLDNLVTVNSKPDLPTQSSLSGAMANPFATLPTGGSGQSTSTAPSPSTQNMFQQPTMRPTINQIRQQPVFGSEALPTPLVPSANPFLS